MSLLTKNYCLLRTRTCFTTHLLSPSSALLSGDFTGLYGSHKVLYLPAKSSNHYKFCTKAFARRKSGKKFVRERRPEKGVDQETVEASLADGNAVSSDGSRSEDSNVKPMQSYSAAMVSSRSDVLQACTITSGLIAALGVLIREVSHVASVEGLPILDCSTEVSFGIELWHLELITGLVVLISSCRYLLLKIWPDFAESSQAANQQVLSSLQPIDYIVVSLLPGVSEELLFRGAMLPFFGMDWKSVLVVAVVFGVLHIGGGRKYSFAIWATFVGFLYGYATITSSTVVVPMASHALNNLVGGILWRQSQSSSSPNLSEK